jgi:hypothetical protein
MYIHTLIYTKGENAMCERDLKYITARVKEYHDKLEASGMDAKQRVVVLRRFIEQLAQECGMKIE